MTSKPLHCAFRIIMSLIFFLIIISSSFKLQNLSNVFQQLRAVTTCKDISVQLFFTDELSWTSEDSSETKEELLLSHVYKYNECVHENLLMSRNECRKKKKKKKKADLTEFHQNEQIFTDLTILTNFCHFC